MYHYTRFVILNCQQQSNKQTNKYLLVNVGEMLHGHCVDILISPQPLLVIDEPVLEQPKCLVRPHPHQTLDGQRLQWLEGLVDALHPARHLTWTVDVVRLHLLSETFLGGGKTNKRPNNIFNTFFMKNIAS